MARLPFRASAHRPGEGLTAGLMFHDFSMFSGRFASEAEATQAALAAIDHDNPVITVERTFADYRKPAKLIRQFDFTDILPKRVKVSYMANGYWNPFVGTFATAQGTIRHCTEHKIPCSIEWLQ